MATSAPTSGNFTEGDFLANTSQNPTCFGWRCVVSGNPGTWVAVGSLLKGDAGNSGYSGFSGYSGASGPAGPQGPQGYSGYSGAAGVAGMPGAVGAMGPAGPMGASGYSGYSGAAGIAGMPGAVGAMGPAGPIGASGYSGYSGASVKPSFRIVTTNDHVYPQDHIVLIDASTQPISLILSDPGSFAGPIHLKKIDRTVNTVTLVGLIDGITNLNMVEPNETLAIVSDGKNIYALSNY